MGVNTDYLGHIDIEPPLNKVECDYLTAFGRSRRSYRRGGPYAVTPQDPDTGNSRRAVDRFNQISDGQPSLWCHWTPCIHGCCLGWDGQEKFYGGQDWLKYLIDHFLRRDAHAKRTGKPQFAGFTFDHATNGIVVGEQQDSRELFVLRVTDGQVDREVLRRGDPTNPWEPGYVGLEDRSWLGEPPSRWDADADVPPAGSRRRN